MTFPMSPDPEAYAALQEEVQRLRQALTDREARLKQLETHLPACLYELHRSPSGDLSWQKVSPGSRDLLRLDPEDFGRWVDRIHPQDAPRWHQAIATSEATETDLAWQGRVFIPQSKGKTIEQSIRILARPQRQEDESTRWQGLAIAIDAPTVHATPSQTPAFFASLLEILPMAVLVKAAEDFRFCAVNSSGAQILGREVEELLGKTDYDLFPPEQADYFRRVDESVLTHHEVVEIPRESVQVGKSNRLMRTRKLAIWDGERPTHVAIVCEDITEQEITKAQLAEQERTLRAIVDNAPIWIWTTDALGHMNFINRTFCEDVGVTPKQVYEAAHYQEVFGLDAVRNCIESDHISFSQDEPCFADERFPFVDGRTHHLETIKVRLKDAQGEVTGLVGLAMDATERKQAEAALAEQRSLLDAFIDTAPVGMAILDPQFRYLEVNENLAKMTGYPVQDHIGRTLGDIVPDLAQTLYGRVEAMLLSGEPILNQEFTGQTAASPGVERHWLFSAFPIQDSRDNLIAFGATVLDITERQQAQQQLQTLTRNLQDAQRIAHIGNWEIDVATGQTTCSDEIFHIVGIPVRREPMAQEEMFQYFHPDDRPLVRQGIRHCIDTGQPYDIDVRILRANGELGYVREKCEAQYDEVGNLVSIFGIAMDITERKRAELTLRESEERFRTLVEATTQIVWNANAKGAFTWEQPDWSEFTGMSFDELRDWGWINSIHPNDRNETTAVWSHAVQTRSLYQIEHRLRRADGEYRDMNVRAVPILDEDGNLREWIGVNTDITDRKDAERALQRSEAKLRQQAENLQATLDQLQRTQNQLVQSEKMSALGQLVAGVAHEINNPVNFIYGNLTHAEEYTQDLMRVIEAYQQRYPEADMELEELLEEVDLDYLIDDLPKLIGSMRVGAQRIRDIVRSLRNFSRLDESEFKAVNLHDGIESTLMILQNRLKAKPDSSGIEIVRRYGNLPAVDCYAGQINQVLMNILANAVDALEERDRNRSPSELDAAPSRITITTAVTRGNYVQVLIADNGVGIPPKVQHQIFDPFFTTKPIGKGTGLGMSISYQIITDKHHGSLTCTSEPGVGTSFLIEIPIHQTVNHSTLS
ncbi:PAS domain S-box protein [Sodalinema gerasimenkoae]|uniref:PAS domain S-box protein n=1 Tax=Sodalinema gerasimenkoae TaxID=2862348 RepID=UPI00135C1157|nr:PAS domain S-box protein [Sodalinema gerasimenkoae]